MANGWTKEARPRLVILFVVVGISTSSPMIARRELRKRGSDVDQTERLLRDVAADSVIRFGTTAPCNPSHFTIRRIGYANIPVVELEIACRREDLRALTPVARQLVFQKLRAHDVNPDILDFTPTVAVERSCVFVDTNPDSPTKGKRKRGNTCKWHFEIKPEGVGEFVWDTWSAKFKDQVKEQP